MHCAAGAIAIVDFLSSDVLPRAGRQSRGHVWKSDHGFAGRARIRDLADNDVVEIDVACKESTPIGTLEATRREIEPSPGSAPRGAAGLSTRMPVIAYFKLVGVTTDHRTGDSWVFSGA